MKVMIIDDEKDTCLYLAAVLEDNGYEAAVLEEGDDVAEGILRENPDLVLLDIMMPVRSGVSIYRQIRLDPRFAAIPVVIMSGMSRPGTTLDREFGVLVGCDEVPMPDGFIEKPVQIDSMLSIVDNILKRRGPNGPIAER